MGPVLEYLQVPVWRKASMCSLGDQHSISVSACVEKNLSYGFLGVQLSNIGKILNESSSTGLPSHPSTSAFFSLIANGNGPVRRFFFEVIFLFKKNQLACSFPLAINGKNAIVNGCEGKTVLGLSLNILLILLSAYEEKNLSVWVFKWSTLEHR